MNLAWREIWDPHSCCRTGAAVRDVSLSCRGTGSWLDRCGGRGEGFYVHVRWVVDVESLLSLQGRSTRMRAFSFDPLYRAACLPCRLICASGRHGSHQLLNVSFRPSPRVSQLLFLFIYLVYQFVTQMNNGWSCLLPPWRVVATCPLPSCLHPQLSLGWWRWRESNSSLVLDSSGEFPHYHLRNDLILFFNQLFRR